MFDRTMDTIAPIPWLRTVLIAEDHEVVSRRVCEAVQQWGATEVRLASSTSELEAHAREMGSRIDLILADIHLTDGACIGALRSIRRSVPRVRVVLMTAELADQRHLDFHRELRPHDFVAKPFTCSELYERMVRLDQEEVAAAWYYDLVRTHGLEGASETVRGQLRDFALADHEGDVDAAAQTLRISRGYLYKLIAQRGDDEVRPPRKPKPARRKR